MFVRFAKDSDANEETVSIKMHIGNAISNDDKTNYETDKVLR